MSELKQKGNTSHPQGQLAHGNNRQKRISERGVIAAVAAFGLVAFLLSAGLAIDISHFYLAGTELQNAADAAALAGASSLNSTRNGLDAAVERATVAMNKYDFNYSDAAITAENVRFAVNLADFDTAEGGLALGAAKASARSIRFVKVKVTPADVSAYLSKIVFTSGFLTLTRTAVAGQSSAGTAPDTEGLNWVTNPAAITLIESSSNPTNLPLKPDTTCANATRYTPGCTYEPTLAPPCAFPSGTYVIGERRLDQGTMWTTNRNKLIAGGLRGKFVTCDTSWVWTHPAADNIQKGMGTTFGDYLGDLAGSANEFPPDTNVKEGISFADYQAASAGSANFTAPPNGLGGVAGRRVILVPIMSNDTAWLDFNDPRLETATMKYNRFGAFFLVNKPDINGKLTLEYIGDRITINGGGRGPSTCPNETAKENQGLATAVLYR